VSNVLDKKTLSLFIMSWLSSRQVVCKRVKDAPVPWIQNFLLRRIEAIIWYSGIVLNNVVIG